MEPVLVRIRRTRHDPILGNLRLSWNVAPAFLRAKATFVCCAHARLKRAFQSIDLCRDFLEVQVAARMLGMIGSRIHPAHFESTPMVCSQVFIACGQAARGSRRCAAGAVSAPDRCASRQDFRVLELEIIDQ